jgi:hypothetical protein
VGLAQYRGEWEALMQRRAELAFEDVAVFIGPPFKAWPLPNRLETRVILFYQVIAKGYRWCCLKLQLLGFL